MRLNCLILVSAFTLVINSIGFSQICKFKTHEYQEIDLRKQLQDQDSRISCLYFKRHNKQYFYKVIDELKQSYFAVNENTIDKSDSINLIKDFDKMVKIFFKRQGRDEKKINRLLKGSPITMRNTSEGHAKDCDLIIEPCYSLELDNLKPLAFVIDINYLLIDMKNNTSYRAIFQ